MHIRQKQVPPFHRDILWIMIYEHSWINCYCDAKYKIPFWTQAQYEQIWNIYIAMAKALIFGISVL